MKSPKIHLKAIAIAQAVAACVNAEGGIGPFAGECAEPSGDMVTLSSQVGEWTYRFHEDGTVDLLDADEAYDIIAREFEFSEEEMEDEYGTREEFEKKNTGMEFEEFMTCQDGWFNGSPLEDACVAFVKAIAEY